jgi:beta-phosphoglucomutase-like phosphatase (HAD superfamily)
MEILLFDMDDVLIEARAYHLALQEVVEHISRALGYRQVHLKQEDIHFFESVGVTSEWDSSAICHALLLERVWKRDPERSLPAQPPLPETEAHDLPLPDFRLFFRMLSAEKSGVVPSLADAERLLLQRRDRSTMQVEILQGIFRNARRMEGSLTHRLFQELILGSRVFCEMYGLEACIPGDGYLLTLDVPALDEHQTRQLREWLAAQDHYAAVFTNRPSKPLGDYFDTPEAELGLKLVGLEGVPIVGHGSLAWMAEKRGLQMDALLKPSPVHALAAMRSALGGDVELALQSAVTLTMDGVGDADWNRLQGTRVTVFEDTAKGLQSAYAAKDQLDRWGISIDLQLRGVSPNEDKAYALRALGAKVYEDLSAALLPVIGMMPSET